MYYADGKLLKLSEMGIFTPTPYFNLNKCVHPNRLVIMAFQQGVQPDGTELAVKHLLSRSQRIDEFLNEVVLITGVRHRKLMKLKGLLSLR